MEKFLVVQLARFGDILQSRRLIQSLELQGEVALCVDKSQEEIARLAYPQLEILPLFGFKADIQDVYRENIQLFAYLKKQAYRKVYTLNYSGLTIALARLFEKGQVKGYICEEGQEGRSTWVQMAFSYMQNRFEAPLHITDYWALLAENPIKGNLVNPSALEKQKAWQEGKGSFQVAVAMAGQHPRRSLPVSALSQVIRALAQRLDKVEFILLGTQKEQKLVAELMSYLPSNIHSMITDKTGKTNYQDLFGIIKDSSLLLSPDTGSLHCGAFVGTASLSFFCSSAWCFETGAYGEGHTCIQACPSCAPCGEKMPCAHVKCHIPFSSPALLARLSANKLNKELENFAILESSFDTLGLIYKEKEGHILRNQSALLRSLLEEYALHNPVYPHTLEMETGASILYNTTGRENFSSAH